MATETAAAATAATAMAAAVADRFGGLRHRANRPGVGRGHIHSNEDRSLSESHGIGERGQL